MCRSKLCGAIAIRRASSLLSLSAVAAAGLVLLVPSPTKADTISPAYQSTPLVMSGDRYGAATIPARADLYVGGLTDAGQIIFSARGATSAGPDLLLQWDGSQFTTIVAPAGGSAATTAGAISWPQDVTLNRPVSVNRDGSAVFSVNHSGGTGSWGTFLWKPNTQSVVPVLKSGMPAAGQQVFTLPGGYSPAINDHGDMALIGQINTAGAPGGFGLFSLTEGQALRPVLLPQAQVPGLGHDTAVAATNEFMAPSINDLGEIAFLTRTRGGSGYGAYLYQFNELLPLALPGQSIPGGGRITSVGSVSLSREGEDALVTATTDQSDGTHWGLYRFAGGKLSVVAAPGTPMPGGGTFKTIQTMFADENAVDITAISPANSADQRVFLATLEDGTAGAYLVDGTGRMKQVFQAVATPKPVTVQEVGYQMSFVPGSRPCLNNHGQVALSVRLQGGHSMIMLLTPNRP